MDIADIRTLGDCKRCLGASSLEDLTSAQALERALYCERRSMEVVTEVAKTFFVRRMGLYEHYAVMLEKAGR